MRFSVLGFNQNKAVELGLDMTDLLLLDYIMYANGNPQMSHVTEDEISYVWLSHAKIHEDLPILNITEGTLRNKITELKNKGLVISKTVSAKAGRGSRAYYSVTGLTVSLQNDVVARPCHSEMTSDKQLTNDIELKDSNSINRITQDDDYNSHGYSFDELKSEFAGSKKTKKPTLYSKCVDEICSYTDDYNLRQVLTDYLVMRLAVKDKPIRGVNQWKGMLNKLNTLQGDKYTIVNQSLEKGWLTFYPITNNSSNKFSEGDGLSCEKSTTTAEERKRILEEKGLRSEF